MKKINIQIMKKLFSTTTGTLEGKNIKGNT